MKFLLPLLSFLLCFAVGNAQTNGSFVHNSATRTFITYVPSTYNPATPTPLVLVLHGLTMSGSSIMSVSGFNALAETNNFIAVYPDGLNNDWNFGGTGASSTDDVGFLNALIDTITSHYNVASNKLFSCGFSAGGFMSYRMACESGRCFAAIASVSGTMGTSVFTSCTPTHKCSVLQIHGSSDFIVPYTGALNNESVDNVIQKWIAFDNCPTTPIVTNLPDKNISDLSTVTTYQYAPGTNNTEVLLYKVIGGGHQWPGTSSILGGLGTINMDINASEEIANFFARHSCADINGLNQLENNNPNWTLREIEQKVFSIEGDGKIDQITVYTVNGQIIVPKITNQHYIDLSALQQGVYILHVKGNNKIQSLRIVL